MTLEAIEAVPVLGPRPRDSHKGRYGHVLVIAGSRGMAGAAALCGAGALRSGAGLVRVATAAEVHPTVASFEPSYMTYPLPCDQAGCIDFAAALPALKKLIEPATVIAVGPGLGQSPDSRKLLQFLIAESDKPLVIDADGLNALVGQTELLTQSKKPIVLTPHPGEFARLSGLPITTVQAERIVRTAAFANLAETLVVVLKGTGSVVSDGKRYYVNTTGNPGMATGGTGDVLTGVIAALLAQKLPAFEAAQLGVFIHGVAGDIARDQNGETSLIAGDLVDALPDAFVHTMPDAESIHSLGQ
jgi:ADP-dependent NAD(P)H-hydrate dehydratase